MEWVFGSVIGLFLTFILYKMFFSEDKPKDKVKEVEDIDDKDNEKDQ